MKKQRVIVKALVILVMSIIVLGNDNYYSGLENLTGENLKNKLYLKIKDHTELEYTPGVWIALKELDEDPENPNNVIGFYTGKSMPKSPENQNLENDNKWNREHVWAKSHGDFGTKKGAGTDLHALRPCDESVNSARGNKEFDESDNWHDEAIRNKTDTDSWEPRDSVKGDVARSLFYMAVRYEGDNGEPDLELSEDINDYYKNPTHGKLSTLLRWHKEDPVDDYETRRNEIIYKNYQYNRNPFIDHPEFVEKIWQ